MSDDIYGNRNYERKTYMSINVGRDKEGRECAVFVRRVPAGTPGCKPVLNKDGVHVTNKKDGTPLYKMEHDFIRGRIIGVDHVEEEYDGRKENYTEITITKGGKTVVLKLKFGDNYWVDFGNRAPYIDAKQEVEIVPYRIHQEGKKHPARFLIPYQAGQKIPGYWNKENNWRNDAEGKGGLPSGKQVENPVDGKLVWTFLDRDRYILQKGYGTLSVNVSQAVAENPPVGVAAPAPEPIEQPAQQAAGQVAAPVTVDDVDPFVGAVEDDEDLPF